MGQIRQDKRKEGRIKGPGGQVGEGESPWQLTPRRSRKKQKVKVAIKNVPGFGMETGNPPGLQVRKSPWETSLRRESRDSQSSPVWSWRTPVHEISWRAEKAKPFKAQAPFFLPARHPFPAVACLHGTVLTGYQGLERQGHCIINSHKDYYRKLQKAMGS